MNWLVIVNMLLKLVIKLFHMFGNICYNTKDKQLAQLLTRIASMAHGWRRFETSFDFAQDSSAWQSSAFKNIITPAHPGKAGRYNSKYLLRNNMYIYRNTKCMQTERLIQMKYNKINLLKWRMELTIKPMIVNFIS